MLAALHERIRTILGNRVLQVSPVAPFQIAAVYLRVTSVAACAARRDEASLQTTRFEPIARATCINDFPVSPDAFLLRHRALS